MTYYGDFPTSHTSVCMAFDTFAAATGAPTATTNFANTDIQIYKNGGTTQRSSANGITVTTSFDTNTGLQFVLIDLSDNTDAGFYAAGNEYTVAVADITADGQTLRFWLGAFSIERAGGVLALLKAGTAKTTLADGVAHGGTLGSSTATLALSRLSVVSQSANTSAVTATGNGTGHGITASSGSGATGNGINSASAATNGHGINTAGNGTGAGIVTTGGATGQGIKAVGGGTSGEGILVNTTSGDGIKSSPTAGHGLNLVANGTSKHGILSTGGGAGTSDGASFAAGTGGVDLRAAITGNVTGNLSGSVGSVTGAVGSVTGSVGGNVTGSVGSVAAGGITASSLAADTITAAKVASDVTDEIWAKTCTEPSGAPAVNGSAIAVLSWLLALARNKITQTSTTQTLRNDADSGNISTSTISDDGTTFTRGEYT